ncbi:MAG: hypothetical protein ACFFBJ_11145 [Promethearchaeota archaeon]
MYRPKHILSIIIISVLFLGIPITVKDATNVISISDSNASPAAIDIKQMLPNPNLETEPDAFVNGSSGEFDYSYVGQTMQLNWTHTQGTELAFHSDDDNDFPSYNDFVYLTQSFDWPFEELPDYAEFNLTYGVTLSGGFDTDPASQNMFKVYIWLIDSSGNWVNVYYSNPPYTSTPQYGRSILNYFDRREGWGGMIKDSTGVQEDPQDILTVGIGLSPTNDFNSSLANGSIMVEVDSVYLHLLRQIEPDPATHLTPLYNKTFASKTSDLIPGAFSTNPPVWDFLRQMTKDPDGNLYMTGGCLSTYEFYEQEGLRSRHQFLIKYDPKLNQKWVVRNDNMTRGRSITYHAGSLYTTGFTESAAPEYDNLILTKWSLNGQKVWEREWGNEFDQVGVAVAVHNDSSIYVVVSDYNIRVEEAYHNSSLLKFDSSGTVLWNKPLPLVTVMDVPGDLWLFEDRLIFLMDGHLTCLDYDGNWLWSKVSGAATCDEDGNIYSAEQTGEGVGISQFDLEGNTTWAVLHKVEYSNGWVEDFSAADVTLTPDGELLILVLGERYDRTHYLLKYSLQGNHLQTWSIGDYVWPPPGNWPPHMEVTSTGLAYFAFVPMTSDIWTQAYVIGNYTLPPPDLSIFVVSVAGGGIAVIALIGIFVYKRKKV